ncbi:hypothetical protein QJS04_geneDACA021111 [Acorus gramineus]|uniref:Uncharacterized protein n=1 Tax=Acorus gramineus TaxID=55184 RepID=A0AAV9BS41_ACOGR|nr:hypothetical protein QJS04_geneDACA021111 [Acorus gramineus]
MDGRADEECFRINPENGQEEHVRDHLNKAMVAEDTDVHCLEGLIKLESLISGLEMKMKQ